MTPNRQATKAKCLRTVVRVGEGRGFVVRGGYDQRLVITAAHCLPSLPEPHGIDTLDAGPDLQKPSEALPQTDEACRVTPTIAEDYLRRSSTHTNVTVKYSLAWQAVFVGYV
jgi:hypothetical protein